jgi:hypothetical protein
MKTPPAPLPALWCQERLVVLAKTVTTRMLVVVARTAVQEAEGQMQKRVLQKGQQEMLRGRHHPAGVRMRARQRARRRLGSVCHRR